ncbi:hypothetical protein PYK79_06435 [Streptomyces sp. ID05-04B]|uniref:hypothetical protein n=1 Tax=unclassified Streptomyces TaxID=2593676 RepID=UPI000D1AE350|nr:MULTISPECIES: hypothetical protein [unclassified Streptomyces]AVV44799.1 hypothetical protein C6376_28770 [Streptomyces sp. P3]MDX5563128.1 hypothetical protein [Streptomyces sp. ID05-04B]
MADIWVFGQDLRRPGETTLVRADALTRIYASGEMVTVAGLESDERIALAHRRAVQGEFLPPGFHLNLVAALSKARIEAASGHEDLVLLAAADDEGQWHWGIHTVSELC